MAPPGTARCGARTSRSYPSPVGGIGDYLTCRRAALPRRLELGFLDGADALQAAVGLLAETATGPAAFFKDSNPAIS
jgi:hypothetical protein